MTHQKPLPCPEPMTLSAPKVVLTRDAYEILGTGTANRDLVLTYCQIAVRGPGVVSDLDFHPGLHLMAGQFVILQGSATGRPGTHEAYLAYSLDGKNWIDGPSTKFVVGGAAATVPPATVPAPMPAQAPIVVPPTKPVPVKVPPAPVPKPAPSRVRQLRAMWYQGWEDPSPSTWPVDVAGSGDSPGIINHVVVAMAQGSGGGGRVSWSPHHPDAPDTIRAWRRRGMNVVIGIGGSGDGGISLRSGAEADQMIETVSALVDRYGFNGIDIDIESERWSDSGLLPFVDSMCNRYGNDFIVGITPALYGEQTEKWLSAARKLGPALNYLAPMLYDFPEARHAASLLDVTLDKIRTCLAGGLPIQKFVFGFKCNDDELSTPTADALMVWQSVLAKYPNIGGAFLWEHRLDANAGWAWTRTVARAGKP